MAEVETEWSGMMTITAGLSTAGTVLQRVVLAVERADVKKISPLILPLLMVR